MPQIIHKDHIQPGMTVYTVAVDMYDRPFALATGKCISWPFVVEDVSSLTFGLYKMHFESESHVIFNVMGTGAYLATLGLYEGIEQWGLHYNKWKTFTNKDEAEQYFRSVNNERIRR